MPSLPPVSGEVTDVTCPFCGLLCDDLVVDTTGGGVAVRRNGCRIALAGFERTGAVRSTPLVAGRPVTLQLAVAEAARLVASARLPLVAGLGTDVAGVRAAARLADRCGGVVDHMNSAASVRNLLVMQDGGWIATTLSEVRNRADLLLVVSSDVGGRFPRFFERCVAPKETLFSKERRCDVVFLGSALPKESEWPGPAPELVPCDPERLHEAFSVLRTIVAGRPVAAREAGGAPVGVWRKLANRLRAARYGVATWAAADFEFPHAELTIQVLCELVKDLNRETRFSSLPLGGSEGDVTAESVLLWQTGYGTRTSFSRGRPEHDSYHFSTARLLATGGADLLLWISSFNEARIPPATAVPTIVLGRDGMALERQPAVFIPVGTPGVDHAGHLFRTDRVVALPVRRLRDSPLPSVADAIAAIEAAV